MKHKHLLRNLLLCTTLCTSLASCGSATTDTTNRTDHSKTDFETSTTDEPMETSKEPVNDEDAVLPLYILTGDYHEQEWSQELDLLLASVTYPIISLEENCAKDYPKLADAMTTFSDARKNALLTEYNDLIETAQDEALTSRENFAGLTTKETVSVRRSDSRVTSLLLDGYSYVGGAHGNSYYTSVNYDTQTGKELELTDIISDTEQLPALVQEQLYTNYDPSDFYENLDLKEYFADENSSITWTLDYNGITFFFSPYEIAPYATGRPTATITFDAHPEIFKKDYLDVPESYALVLSANTPYEYDFNGDHSTEQLTVWGRATEYYDCDQICINMNGQTTEDTLGAFEMEAVLVHTADDKNYLYVESTSENDYKKLTVYDLTSGTAVKVDSVYGGFYTPFFNSEEYNPSKLILTNPEEFLLDTRTELLSTISGHKTYSVGADGMPVTKDELYVFDMELTFTLLQPLEVSIVDEKSGEVTGKRTLDAGTEVIYYRTDDESIADLKLPDGSIGRITIDSKEWPRTINNISIEEIFENLLFAG